MIGVNDYFGKYVEELNNKVDLDCTNISAAGVSKFISLMMPDYTSEIPLGLPASPLSTTTTTFTAPCDGYVLIHADRSAAGNRIFIDLTKDGITITREGVGYTADSFDMFMLVEKGTNIRAYTNTTSATWSITRQYFYKMKGATL